MKYEQAILDMGDDHFESMINSVCQRLLGLGVVSFTKGRDGGKDGRFTGVANSFPSKKKPWKGKMIIQAKHTSIANSLCTSSEFFTSKGSVINKEIKRLKKLQDEEGFDKYLLFTNRKYTGGADSKIIEKISKEVGLLEKDISIIGIETLNRYLNTDKTIPKDFELDKYMFPFDFSEVEIREIIIAFKEQLPAIESDLKSKVKELKYDLNLISAEEKNKKNDLGHEYFRNQILSSSLMDFSKIDNFLSDNRNSEFKEYYFDIAAELSNKISIQRENFGAFEELFVFIHDFVCRGNEKLKGGKRHVYTLLHYMYVECLIGIK